MPWRDKGAGASGRWGVGGGGGWGKGRGGERKKATEKITHHQHTHYFFRRIFSHNLDHLQLLLAKGAVFHSTPDEVQLIHQPQYFGLCRRLLVVVFVAFKGDFWAGNGCAAPGPDAYCLLGPSILLRVFPLSPRETDKERGVRNIPTRSLLKSTWWEWSSMASFPALTKAPKRYSFPESIPGVDERSTVSSLPADAAC